MEKDIAVLIVAKELKLNHAYYEAWQKGIATAMINALQDNNIAITENLANAASLAGEKFLDSVIAGAEHPEDGWVYNYEQ